MKNIISIINDEIKNFISENEEYFTQKLPDDVKRNSKKYVGKNVIWYGSPDQMIVINKDQVRGMWGNIYDPQKMKSLEDLIRNSEEHVELECSYGLGDVVNLTNVIEHQEANHTGNFEIDFDGFKRPYTTGDRDLDLYIGTQDVEDLDFTYLEDLRQEVLDFFETHKFELGQNINTAESLQSKFNELNPDENEQSTFDEFLEREEDLRNAVLNNDGDLGNFMVQLRDGHHRVMAAINAGEENVCVNLVKEDIPRYKNYINKV